MRSMFSHGAGSHHSRPSCEGKAEPPAADGRSDAADKTSAESFLWRWCGDKTTEEALTTSSIRKNSHVCFVICFVWIIKVLNDHIFFFFWLRLLFTTTGTDLDNKDTRIYGNSTIQYFQYNSQTFLWSRWDRASFLAFGNSRVAFSSLSLCTVKLSFVAFGRNWLSSCYLGSQSPCLTRDCFFLSSAW